MDAPNKELDLIEMGFDELDEFGSGITAMSIVKSPAIKSNFITLSEQKEYKFAEADTEKRLLIGPALVPDLPIYRRDQNGYEYYAYFKAETIEKLAYAFLKNGRQNNSTVEHEFAVDGVGMVESWIVTDREKDKATALGMEVPNGTWMIAMKVYNEEVWSEWVKTGKVAGFSVEALLMDKPKEAADKVEQSHLTEKDTARINAAIETLQKLYKRNEEKA